MASIDLILTALAAAVALLYAAYHGVLAWALLRPSRFALGPAPAHWPSVSVLIPARNEAKYISACIESVSRTRYQGLWDIIVGNDRSTDNTSDYVQALCATHANLQLIQIDTTWPDLAGKQNVLAQLARHTTADICLVVDADCTVLPTWVEQQVRAFDAAEVGMVSGPTVVEASGLMGQLQALDWRYGMGSFQALAELGYPVTAVGNNMGWRRTAYRALGGYEALPFSLVEDYQLFRAMRAAGWAVRLPAEPTLLNRSAAVSDLHTLLRQRRRWLQGARQSGAPFYARLPFVVQAAVALAAGAAAVALGAAGALALLGLKAAVDAAFLATVNHRLRLGQRAALRWLLPHQLYLLLALVLLPAYLYWPGPTVWKGRAIRP